MWLCPQPPWHKAGSGRRDQSRTHTATVNSCFKRRILGWISDGYLSTVGKLKCWCCSSEAGFILEPSGRAAPGLLGAPATGTDRVVGSSPSCRAGCHCPQGMELKGKVTAVGEMQCWRSGWAVVVDLCLSLVVWLIAAVIYLRDFSWYFAGSFVDCVLLTFLA